MVLDEIVDSCNKKGWDYEIIPVNDDSPDNVWKVLKTYATDNNRIKPIALAKNMNRTPAIMAGLSKVNGEIIVTMDDDGQCPVDKLEMLISPLEDSADVSIAKYPKKKQSRFKNFGSKLNAIMSQILIGKPSNLQISNFIAIKRFVVDEIIKYNNPYPYFSGLLLRTTSRIVNVQMEERNRLEGNSTYTMRKLISVWLNGFTAFSVKPLRIASVCGFICSTVGFFFGLFIIIRKFINPSILAGYSSIVAILLLMGGIIMIMLGLIGEYIGRIYICLNSSPQYVIKETLNLDDNDDFK